jgi:outer membrane protein OmpA-like peptidoglycan-associated protein
MRWLVVLVAGCATTRAPQIEHHAPTPPAPAPEVEHPHRVVVTDTEIEMLPDVWWQGATASFTPDGERALDLIAHTLEVDDNIRVMEVRAFGGSVSAWALGDARAHAIVDGLVARHVDPKRLVPRGFAEGPSAPVLTILDREP